MSVVVERIPAVYSHSARLFPFTASTEPSMTLRAPLLILAVLCLAACGGPRDDGASLAPSADVAPQEYIAAFPTGISSAKFLDQAGAPDERASSGGQTMWIYNVENGSYHYTLSDYKIVDVSFQQ